MKYLFLLVFIVSFKVNAMQFFVVEDIVDQEQFESPPEADSELENIAGSVISVEEMDNLCDYFSKTTLKGKRKRNDSKGNQRKVQKIN